MVRVGIFSGSFNPIHWGHIILAGYLCEHEKLDEVRFVVSPHNPLKNSAELAEDTVRLEMVKLAVADYPRFRSSDTEIAMPRPSYTIRTLDELKKQEPDKEFSLIMGGDNWSQIHQWKEYRRLVDENPILVYPRRGYDKHGSAVWGKAKYTDAPLVEISSTWIRRAIALGHDVRYFLPLPVFDYIEQNGLYRG